MLTFESIGCQKIYGYRIQMSKKSIRIVLNEEAYRKFKVYCAIANISMTEQTNNIVIEYIKKCEVEIKIIKKST